MFSVRRILSLPIYLSTAITFALAATPQGCISNDNTDKNICGPSLAAQLTGGEGCQPKQLKEIRDGFANMNSLFKAALNPNFDTGDPEREFFGQRDRIANYTSLIESNIQRASWYAHPAGSSTRNPDIHVRCDDPNGACEDGGKQDGKHVAYNIGNDPHINFCRKYFSLDGLDETVENVAKDQKNNMDLTNYYNRGTAWARQVMHISAIATGLVERWDGTTSNGTLWNTKMVAVPINTSVLAGVQDDHPQTPFMTGELPNGKSQLKYAYGATRSKLLTILSTQMAYDAANNAESYAMYAQARYVIAKKDFYPAEPVIKFNTENDLLMDNKQQNAGDEKRYACWNMLDVK